MRQSPDINLVKIALERTNGGEFQAFVDSFLAAIIGPRYIPMSGVHDGGADGLIEETIYRHDKRPDSFMQASIEKESKAKIRRTIKRLREFGRAPQHLLYVTNRAVPSLDVVEDNLSTDLNVVIRIRDGNYIATQVPPNRHATAAYYQYLHHQTTFLEGIARGSILTKSNHITDPHVYTYLVGELERHSQSSSFADGVVDAMIVFALEGTDPNLNRFMTESDIHKKISELLPTATPLLNDRLRQRLEAISAKANRRIKWHMKEDLWVLPYEDRKVLHQISAEDEYLRIGARQELCEIFATMSVPSNIDIDDLAELTLNIIQRAFEEDGLRFSRSLNQTNFEYRTPFLSDITRAVLTEKGFIGEGRLCIADCIHNILRIVFYNSRPTIRKLLQRISRAYGIAFVLRSDPRVVRYFDEVLNDTWLYVGTDIIVSALSEQNVQREDQHTRNLLRAASYAGAQLWLTAPVLDEVLAHIRKSDRGYCEYIARLSPIDSYDVARQIPYILVRAFLYTQVFDDQRSPYSWEEFVGRFCDYPILHKADARRQLQTYLLYEFNLRFENWTDVRQISSRRRHLKLTKAVKDLKHNELIAKTDAYMYEIVTSRRLTRKEEKHNLEFGHQTWWLSGGEDAAVGAMAMVEKSSPNILMRPGFLAKFIHLAPSALDARTHLSEFLPSLLGIRIARRITEEDFHKLMRAVKKAESMQDARKAARIQYLIDVLKSTGRKDFDERFALDTTRDFVPIDNLYASRQGPAVTRLDS